MSANATSPTITDADFDAWDENKEAAALAAIAEQAQIKYLILPDSQTFVGRLPDGYQIRTPLRITQEVIEQVDALADKGPKEQLGVLLGLLGQDEDLERLRREDMVTTMSYASAYFGALEKVLKITLGE